MPLPRFGPRQSPQANGLAPLALFRFRVESGPSLTPDTRQPPTFARASSSIVSTVDGRLARVPANVPAFTVHPVAGEASRTFLRVEPASANLVAAGETFDGAQGWIEVGSPGVVPGAFDAGAVTLARLVDANAGSASPVVYVLAGGTFSGNGSKAVTCYVARGLNANAAGSTIRLRDTSANTDRGNVTVTFNADGSECTVLIVNGQALPAEPIGRGLFRIKFRATGVVAANTHQIQVYPVAVAAAASAQGDVFVGGVQVEDRETPTSYIPRPTTSDAGTRAADLVSWTWLDTRPPVQGDLTLEATYVLNVGDAAPASPRTVLSVGDADDRLSLEYEGTVKRARYKHDATEATSSTPATSFGDGLRYHAGAFSRLGVAPRVEVSIDDTFGTPGDAASGFTAWPDPSAVRIGLATGVADPIHVEELAILAGRRTLTDCLARY